jgi:hypothetical protein
VTDASETTGTNQTLRAGRDDSSASLCVDALFGDCFRGATVLVFRITTIFRYDVSLLSRVEKQFMRLVDRIAKWEATLTRRHVPLGSLDGQWPRQY